MNKFDFDQLSLFEEANISEEKRELIIGKKANRVLSKSQQTFNRYIQKIQRLQSELRETEVILEQKLAYYGGQIHPLEQEMLAVRKKLVKQLYGFYKGNMPVSKADRSILREIIAGQLNNIMGLDSEPLDEELKKIFKAIEGISYEKAREEDFEMMRDEMAEMFEDFGFEMNLDGLHSNMTDEEMLKKIREMQESLKGQSEEMDTRARSRKRKKTKKQTELEERKKQLEEARKKNITGIYRQLAKALHPDLEPDAVIKAEKEILMKELTEAYQNNDLHTLLRLELLWVQKEENNPEKLTEEKLDIYNQVLKEQVQGLEDDIAALPEHPRFLPLQRFRKFYEPLKKINLEKGKNEISFLIADMQKSSDALNEKNALQEIKQVVAVFRNAQKRARGSADGFNEEYFDKF